MTNTQSGNIFGWTPDAAMGWTPSALGKEEYLILSTQGGIAQKMASPIAFPVIFNFWNDRYHAPILVLITLNQ
ncbi:MAG: hypothetical protein ACXW4Q_05675 [Anaerolineales bacterium]